jgi:hypothetical protein
MVSNRMRKIVVIGLVIVLGVVFLQPVVAVINDNTGVQSVGNESVTADLGNFTELNGYSLVNGSVEVTDDSGTTIYSEGTDYEVDYEAGKLKALTGGSISDGESLLVDYDYEATESGTTTVLGFVPVMFGVLLLVASARGIQSKL